MSKFACREVGERLVSFQYPNDAATSCTTSPNLINAMDSNRLKGRSPYPFETIAVALAFSPRLEGVLSEARQLAHTFKAKLLLIHVGKRSPEKEATLRELCANGGMGGEVQIIWGNGDPVTTLLEICKGHMVDLLILGARRRESVFRYYLGSVARGLSRRAKCSILLLTEPEISGTSFRKVVVDCVDHPKTPHTLNTAVYFAGGVGAPEIRAVREVDPEGLAMVMAVDSTTDENDQLKAHLAENGEAKLQELLAATPKTGPVVETAVLFGRPGFAIRGYAEECDADLLVINSPDGRYRLMDRIFTHDLEYILEHLPCNMLIVHSRLAEGS